MYKRQGQSSKATYYSHIHTLFSLYALSRKQQDIMCNLCFLPYTCLLYTSVIINKLFQRYFRCPNKVPVFPVSKIHRKTELYVLQESAIRLLLLINIHLFYKAVKKFFLLPVSYTHLGGCKGPRNHHPSCIYKQAKNNRRGLQRNCLTA